MPIPCERRAAVDRALTAAFATTELDGAAPLTGGLSGAEIFRIRVGGIGYVLRLEGPGDAFRDPHRTYPCMAAAAKACIAPRLIYADPVDGVAIMDLVDERSLTLDYRGTREDLIVELAQTLRVQHALPPFPRLVDYMDGMDAVTAQFQASGVIDPAACAELIDRYRTLRAAYRTDPADLVASHNDLNPRNTIYDGRRVWFIDWESAFQADRFVDLATLANIYAAQPVQEDLLLTSYLGRSPTSRERARLKVMRVVNDLFYGFMMLAAVGVEQPQARGHDLAARSLAELGLAISLGDFALEAWESRLEYGKARLASALAGLRDPSTAQALAAI